MDYIKEPLPFPTAAGGLVEIDNKLVYMGGKEVSLMHIFKHNVSIWIPENGLNLHH